MSAINPVFRVRGIPVDDDIGKVITTLREAYAGFPVDRNTNACTIVPSPYSTTNKSALIQFFRTPPALARLGTPGQKDTAVIDFGRPGMIPLIIDKEFYELTQLYEPNPLPIIADIVAVSGLNGHAYGSWRSKVDQNMWLRHFLSKDLPSCRTMIFGCNTRLSDNSDHEISEYAATLLEELNKARRTPEEKARPIVFVGHSFGGVIVAQAIVKARADSQNDRGWKDIFDSTRGIAFFGTPHQGLNLDDLQGMLKEGSPRKRLLEALKAGNSQLKEDLSKFVNCCDNIKIITFYEVKPTKTVVTSPDGVSTATGDPRMRVDRESAILKLPSKTEQAYVADGDHSDMVKFKHNQERSYLNFLSFFRGLDLSPRAPNQPQMPAPAPTPAPSQPTPAPSQPTPAPSQPTPAPPQPTPAPPQPTPAPTPSLPHTPAPPQGPGIPGPSPGLPGITPGGGSTPKTALDAVLSNDPSSLRAILQQTPGVANQRQRNNTTTLLHIAIENGFESVALALLDYPVNLDARDQNGLTALRLAAGKGLSGVVRAILLRQGQLRNTDEAGWGLISACSQGHLGTAQVLLEFGVSPEWQSPHGDGIRALHAAAIGGHALVVRLLLQYGAAIYAVEAQGRNALHLAVLNNRFDVVRELIPAHISKCVCLNTPDRSGYSPLHYAASMGHQAVAELLLQSGVTVGINSPDGSTPLALAAGAGHRGIVSLLLARGADVNAVDRRGMSPLSLASKHGYVETVEELLGRGALIDPVDAFNYSAINYANAGGHMRVVQLLSTVREQRIRQMAQRGPGLQAQANISILGFGLSFGAQTPPWR